jgi:hypothetical protein
MKKVIYSILMGGALFLAGACVDDYTDSNPPRKKDAPTLRLAETSTGLVAQVPGSNNYQYGYKGVAIYGQQAVFEVSVIDAPGIINSATVSFSIPDFGSAALDEASFNAVKGKETGTFRIIFTPNPNVPDAGDRTGNIVVTVSDAQLNDKGASAPLTTTLTFPLTVGACNKTGLAGTYEVTAASGNFDRIAPYSYANDGGPYDLQTILEDREEEHLYVTITEVRPGRYTIDELTAGIWSTYYTGRANPALDVDFCGDEISGNFGSTTAGAGTSAQRTFTINGIVNGDGTIDIEWSYTRDVGAPPEVYAQGSYTLTKVE